MNNDLPIMGHGAEPSKTSIQDIQAAQVLDMAPMPLENFEIIYDLPHVNQRAIGICTAADLVDMAQKIWGRKFSMRFTMAVGKEVYDQNTIEGSSNLTMLKVGKNFGFLPVEFDPDGNDTHGTYLNFINKSYTPEQYAEAAKFKIKGYAAVALDPVGFALALQKSKYGLLTRMAVGDNFYTDVLHNVTWDKSRLEFLTAPNPPTGGHSIKAVAHQGLSLSQIRKLRNSWGDQQNPTADNGMVWCGDGDIRYVYSTQQPYVTEAHVVLMDEIVFKHKFSIPIKMTDKTPEVVALQRVLVQLGYLVMPEGVAMGYYGPLTAAAVLKAQKALNAAPTPILDALGGRNVGPATRAALNLAQGL